MVKCLNSTFLFVVNITSIINIITVVKKNSPQLQINLKLEVNVVCSLLSEFPGLAE